MFCLHIHKGSGKSPATHPDDMDFSGIHIAFPDGKRDGIFYIADRPGAATSLVRKVWPPEVGVDIIPVFCCHLLGQRVVLGVVAAPGMQAYDEGLWSRVGGFVEVGLL